MISKFLCEELKLKEILFATHLMMLVRTLSLWTCTKCSLDCELYLRKKKKIYIFPTTFFFNVFSFSHLIFVDVTISFLSLPSFCFWYCSVDCERRQVFSKVFVTFQGLIYSKYGPCPILSLCPESRKKW